MSTTFHYDPLMINCFHNFQKKTMKTRLRSKVFSLEFELRFLFGYFTVENKMILEPTFFWDKNLFSDKKFLWD